jgi:hypothetical protein
MKLTIALLAACFFGSVAARPLPAHYNRLHTRGALPGNNHSNNPFFKDLAEDPFAFSVEGGQGKQLMGFGNWRLTRLRSECTTYLTRSSDTRSSDTRSSGTRSSDTRPSGARFYRDGSEPAGAAGATSRWPRYSRCSDDQASGEHHDQALGEHHDQTPGEHHDQTPGVQHDRAPGEHHDQAPGEHQDQAPGV